MRGDGCLGGSVLGETGTGRGGEMELLVWTLLRWFAGVVLVEIAVVMVVIETGWRLPLAYPVSVLLSILSPLPRPRAEGAEM